MLTVPSIEKPKKVAGNGPLLKKLIEIFFQFSVPAKLCFALFWRWQVSCGHSVARLGYFWKILVARFISYVAEILGSFLSYFEKSGPFQVKSAVVIFWTNFGLNWATFNSDIWSHWLWTRMLSDECKEAKEKNRLSGTTNDNIATHHQLQQSHITSATTASKYESECT